MKINAKIAFCIPVYNEERSINNIYSNIKLISDTILNPKIFIIDNKSTDRTYQKLLQMRKLYKGRVFVFKQKENIGFSKNLSSFGCNKFINKQKNIKFFQFLGADDTLIKRGLEHLLSIVKNNSDANLIISNWQYFEKNKIGKIVLGDFDKNQKEEFYDLRSFFSSDAFIPGGIMQFCVHKDKLQKITSYENEINPHAGLFFECFPGKVVFAGPPGLCQVERLPSYGWRADPRSVFKAHVKIFQLYIRLINCAYKNKVLCKNVYYDSLKKYTRLSKIVLNDCLVGAWGRWEPKPFDSVKNFFYLLKGCCQGSLHTTIGNLRYLQKESFKKNLRLTKKGHHEYLSVKKRD